MRGSPLSDLEDFFVIYLKRFLLGAVIPRGFGRGKADDCWFISVCGDVSKISDRSIDENVRSASSAAAIVRDNYNDTVISGTNLSGNEALGEFVPFVFLELLVNLRREVS
jgi:hypothetical protein